MTFHSSIALNDTVPCKFGFERTYLLEIFQRHPLIDFNLSFQSSTLNLPSTYAFNTNLRISFLSSGLHNTPLFYLLDAVPNHDTTVVSCVTELKRGVVTEILESIMKPSNVYAPINLLNYDAVKMTSNHKTATRYGRDS